MSSVQVVAPFDIFMDVDGNPLEDGYIFIGSATLDPESNPISAFFDAALTLPATQPIRTKGGYPSNVGAAARIYVGSVAYSVRVKNKNSFTIQTDLNRANPFLGGTLQDALNEAPPVTLASAATVNIGAAASNSINISGTTTITAFDSIPAGARRMLQFLGALTLTHNGTSLILPNAVNFVTAAGDALEFISLGSGNWECVGVHRRVSNAVSLDVLGTNGMLARTAAGAVTARTITGTANEITVTNGDGVAGAPTLSLPSPMSFAGKTISDLGSVTTADINGGTVDGTVIGGAAAAAGTFTTTSAATATVSTLLDLTGGIIRFPAVQIPSAGANDFDDYEEGTWTPILTFSTPGNLVVAYTTQSGTYTKIGQRVFYDLTLQTSTFTHTTASGNLRVTGLPFTVGITSTGPLSWNGITKASYSDIAIIPVAGQTYNEFIASGSGVTRDSIDTADMPTGGTVVLTSSFVHRV